jgi:hypothetical protein
LFFGPTEAGQYGRIPEVTLILLLGHCYAN